MASAAVGACCMDELDVLPGGAAGGIAADSVFAVADLRGIFEFCCVDAKQITILIQKDGKTVFLFLCG